MKRLLIVSDSPAIQSGQARVVRELAGRFASAGVDVTVFGWFHFAALDADFPYRIIDGGDSHKTAPAMVGMALESVEPDTVLCIGDPWDFAWLSRKRAAGGKFQLVGYLNIEAEPVPSDWEVLLDGFDVITTTSAWGAKVLGRGSRAIHHGVDTSVFFPTPKPESLLDRKLAETFTVLLNGQNTQRKALATALQGFALFAKDKADVLCYANTQAVPAPSAHPGQNLHELALQLGIQNLVCFNPQNSGPLDTIDDEQMNQIYGLADALLMTSQAEGFGLPVLEAMATKTVPIATRGFSMLELLDEGRGELIPAVTSQRNLRSQDYLIVDRRDVAGRLEVVYQAWKNKRLERYHTAGIQYVLSHSWDRTYEALVEEIARPIRVRLARGGSINGQLRQVARATAAQHPKTVAVLKIGGLGDMLQTTVVVRAAARKYGDKVVVFCNGHYEVFGDMPEVAAVVPIPEMLQTEAARSIADCFPRLLDVRYVSVTHGEPVTAYAKKHQYFYTHWAGSNARIGDLHSHTTQIMLNSLGLTQYYPDGIQPIFEARAETDVSIALSGMDYICVSSGVGTLGGLKRWPDHQWKELLLALPNSHWAGSRHMSGFLPPVQVGGLEDPVIPGALDRRGRSLAETATILACAKRLIAVEGGMVHLARAVGCISSVIFGPTPIQAFGYPENVNLVTENFAEDGHGHCAPCFWTLPAWGSQTCTRGLTSCANFPRPQLVADTLFSDPEGL